MAEWFVAIGSGTSHRSCPLRRASASIAAGRRPLSGSKAIAEGLQNPARWV
jgi:hypothetical protein